MFCVFELFAACSGFTGVLIVVAHPFSNKVMSTLRHFGNLCVLYQVAVHQWHGGQKRHDILLSSVIKLARV